MELLIGIQCRTNSRRFHNKAMAEINGVPALEKLILEARSSKVGKVLTLVPHGDKLVTWLQDKGYDYFEGPEHDVLGRYWGAVLEYQPRYVMRLTADCPLITRAMIQGSWLQYMQDRIPYWSNRKYFCDGFDIEIFRSDFLQYLNMVIKEKNRREHCGDWRVARLMDHTWHYSLDYEGDVGKIEKVLKEKYDPARETETLDIAREFDE